MNINVDYELTLDDTGVTLTQGGEVMWVSPHDDEFVQQFGADDITGEELDEVASWLVENQYLPPGVEVHFVDEIDGDDWMDNVDVSEDLPGEDDDEEGDEDADI